MKNVLASIDLCGIPIIETHQIDFKLCQPPSFDCIVSNCIKVSGGNSDERGKKDCWTVTTPYQSVCAQRVL